jgi:uncharacterized membrane protein YesL
LIYKNWFFQIEIIIFIVGILLATLYFGDQMNGQSTFGLLFAHGFRTATVSICLVFVYTWLSVYLFFPGFIESRLEQNITFQAGIQHKTSEEIKQYLSIAKKVFMAGNLMGNLIAGALGSLLGATIAKKNDHSTD